MKGKHFLFNCLIFFTIFLISQTAIAETSTYVYLNNSTYSMTGYPDTNGDCYAYVEKTFYGGNYGQISSGLNDSGLNIRLNLFGYNTGELDGTARAYEQFTLTGPIESSTVSALMNFNLSGSMLIAPPLPWGPNFTETAIFLDVWVEKQSPWQSYSGYSGDFHMQYGKNEGYGHYGNNLWPTTWEYEYIFGEEFINSNYVEGNYVGKATEYTNKSIQAKFTDLPLNVPLEFKVSFISWVTGNAGASNFSNTLTFDTDNPIVLGTFDGKGNFIPFDEGTASLYTLTSTSGALEGLFQPDGNGNGSAVPEPATMLLLGSGLLGLWGARRKLKK